MTDMPEPGPDAIWIPENVSPITHVVQYAERRVRDRRWLWLRKRTVVKIAGFAEREEQR